MSSFFFKIIGIPKFGEISLSLRTVLSLSLRLALFVIAAALVYHLLWGRLFAWSPVKLGYKSLPFQRADIILPNDWSLPPELQNADGIFADCENFHGLRFNKHITIILAKTPEVARRCSGVRGAACAFQTGTVIFLSPTKILANGRKLTDQLKHECSHALLDQNTSLYCGFNIPEWFFEGLAIFYGNPHDNYTGNTFLELAVDRGYFFDVLGPYDTLKKVPEQYRYGFKHSEFRCFVEYLAAKYGIKTILAYAKDLIQDPWAERALFERHFNKKLETVADEFRKEVYARQWPSSTNEGNNGHRQAL
ncbi:MAG TPA: hypothetical protein PLI09_06500 [Candidatus Hydrogenedentes bacterium]|nr:hypothetical protein [Candidatus Hydrogenedentota bacterium]